MVSPSPDSLRLSRQLADLREQLLAAGGDVERIAGLARRLSRLAAEITAACERAFLISVEVQAA